MDGVVRGLDEPVGALGAAVGPLEGPVGGPRQPLLAAARLADGVVDVAVGARSGGRPTR